MAASVRVEDEAFSDRRYERLAVEAGLADADHARGKMAVLWRQCTLEQTHVLDDHDVISVLGARGVDALITSRLGERVDGGGIRIRGTKGRIEWLKRLRDNGKHGKSGGRPRKKKNPAGLADDNPKGGPSASPDKTPPAPAPAPAPALDLVVLEGDSDERTVPAGALNAAFEKTWHWSISPKWWPSYSKLAPYSPAELRAARLAVERLCLENGGKPNPGLYLRKIEDGRVPAAERQIRARDAPARNGKVGYHPGSPPEEFVNGTIDLNKV
jgi:hypothetical protein